MGISHTWHFDAPKYRIKYRSLSDLDLYKKHHKKTRKMASLMVATTWSGAGIILTGMLSAFSYAYCLRQRRILDKQQLIIVLEMQNRGFPIPRWRKRDLAIGFTIGLLAIGADVGLDILPELCPEIAEILIESLSGGGEGAFDPSGAVQSAAPTLLKEALSCAADKALGTDDAMRSDMLQSLSKQ